MPVTNNPLPNMYTPIEETFIPGSIEPSADESENPNTPLDAPTTIDGGIHGLTSLELNDPNSIRVTISDPTSPLVVLFGPPSCGKTMTLVRLTRFLKSEGYIVTPIRTFRPTADTNYEEICKNFDETMNSDKAAESTNRISFMLVAVIKNGRTLCQILEAPGEYYFTPESPNATFPNYVNSIISSPNRKVWTIMVEPEWMDDSDRRNYVTRIAFLKQNMRAKDSTIFVFNKIDKTTFVRGVGQINKAAAIEHTKNLYPNIFVPFMNQNPITKIVKKYNCDFVPFQTGYYTPTITGGFTYQEGPREYCVMLWNSIMKQITG